MNAFIFALALIPQGTNQARLHPADALVMVEVPNVTKLLAAYEKAPMMSMLRDADVQKSFYGAFEGSSVDFDDMVASALQDAGMPESFAKAPLAGIRHHLEGVAAASFSVSLDAGGLEAYAPRVARLTKIAEQVGALHEAIGKYVGEAEASPATLPKDLAALGLPAQDTLDPWGHAYVYAVEPDGSYTLRSLGADGKVGGTGDDADVDATSVEQAAASFLDLLGFQVVVEFQNQPALDEMRTMVAGLVTKSGAEAARSGPFQMSGVQGELQSWKTSAPALQSLEFWLMRAQNMLVFGSGRCTPEAFAARLADARVQTAADQFYAGLQRDFGAPTGATVVQGSLRLADYAASFRKFAEETDGNTDGLDMLEGSLPNASMRMQLVGERFVTELTATYPKPGNQLISKALSVGPLPPELLTSVPEDAIGVYVASLDGALLWEALKQELSGEDSTESPSPQEQLASFEEKYHFSVEDDIFGSLGNGVVMYLLPLRGITSLPGMAMVVKLKDAAAMQRGVEGLMALLEEEAGDEFSVRNKPYRDAPLWTFSFDADEGGASNPLMNAFSPSITIVKDRLIVALNSTHIKKEIKRALGEETGVHLIATEGHRPPADATAYGYMDWAHFLDGVYEGGRGLANMMGDGLPVDVTTLPEPAVFTRFFKPTLYYTRTLPSGTYMRNESSFGPEVWLGLIGSGFVFGASRESEELDGGPESTEGEAGDKTEQEVDSASAAATKSSMRYVATRVAVYQMDTGKYPATLEALGKPTTNYPEGFLGREGLPKDGFGRAFQYTVLENGARYRLWSTGPDGVDQQGAGDDLVSP